MKKLMPVCLVLCLALINFGCASWSKTAKGGTIGAAGGGGREIK